MGPLGELGALFNPGMRHEEEEKRSKELLREEEGTGRKGDLGIDLESGVVVIDRRDEDDETASTAHTAEPSDDATESEDTPSVTDSPRRPAQPEAHTRAGKQQRRPEDAPTRAPRQAPVGKARYRR